MIVVIVGSNPSTASKGISPFLVNTKSRATLDKWICDMSKSYPQEIYAVRHLNVANHTTENNRPLNLKEIKAALETLETNIKSAEPDRVIAVGKTATKALTLLCIPHLAMPHPSGLNRQLNDPEFVAQKIKELAEYCSPAPKV